MELGYEKNGFPKDFFWGAATAAHQVEGDNQNDWTEWEQKNAKLQMLNAKNRVWPDFILKNYPNPLQEENYISGKACDHYHRFRQDFDIAQSLGHNAHRFSLEWSRVEPEEGRFDEREIAHYREVIHALRERGIEPFVTLWHWTVPLWVSRRGGVENKEFPRWFSRFCEKVVGELKGDVKFWMTLNEPTSVIANSFLHGIWPPQKKSFRAALQVFQRLAKAHRRAYKVIHRVSPNAQVGFGNLMVYFEPYRRVNPLDRIAVAIRDFWTNKLFLLLTRNTHDYFALQYYFHSKIQFPNRIQNENTRVSDMGWELYPAGLYYLLRRLAAYGKPIYITENGLADARDKHRAWFIRESMRQISLAILDGADVRGYFHWSLLDNFEWDKGFWPRFGLVEVDYRTLERKIRPSAWEYKEIVEAARLPH